MKNTTDCDFCESSNRETSNLSTTNENICTCCSDGMSEDVLDDWYDAYTTNPENYELAQEVMQEINQL